VGPIVGFSWLFTSAVATEQYAHRETGFPRSRSWPWGIMALTVCDVKHLVVDPIRVCELLVGLGGVEVVGVEVVGVDRVALRTADYGIEEIADEIAAVILNA